MKSRAHVSGGAEVAASALLPSLKVQEGRSVRSCGADVRTRVRLISVLGGVDKVWIALRSHNSITYRDEFQNAAMPRRHRLDRLR